MQPGPIKGRLELVFGRQSITDRMIVLLHSSVLVSVLSSTLTHRDQFGVERISQDKVLTTGDRSSGVYEAGLTGYLSGFFEG